MKTKTDITQEKEIIPVQRAQQESSDGGTAQLEDNRVTTTYQRKLQEGIHEFTNQSTTPIQRKVNPERSRRNNTGLPDNLKSGIENLSGYSMDDVKVHYNSSKPAQLQAHAYAQGTDIHLGTGQEKHLPHEAWHVVQQKQGRVKPTMQFKGKVNINDDAGLEREADVMGMKAKEGGKGTMFENNMNEGKSMGCIQMMVIDFNNNRVATLKVFQTHFQTHFQTPFSANQANMNAFSDQLWAEYGGVVGYTTLVQIQNYFQGLQQPIIETEISDGIQRFKGFVKSNQANQGIFQTIANAGGNSKKVFIGGAQNGQNGKAWYQRGTGASTGNGGRDDIVAEYDALTAINARPNIANWAGNIIDELPPSEMQVGNIAIPATLPGFWATAWSIKNDTEFKPQKFKGIFAKKRDISRVANGYMLNVITAVSAQSIETDFINLIAEVDKSLR